MARGVKYIFFDSYPRPVSIHATTDLVSNYSNGAPLSPFPNLARKSLTKLKDKGNITKKKGNIYKTREIFTKNKGNIYKTKEIFKKRKYLKRGNIYKRQREGAFILLSFLVVALPPTSAVGSLEDLRVP